MSRNLFSLLCVLSLMATTLLSPVNAQTVQVDQGAIRGYLNETISLSPSFQVTSSFDIVNQTIVYDPPGTVITPTTPSGGGGGAAPIYKPAQELALAEERERLAELERSREQEEQERLAREERNKNQNDEPVFTSAPKFDEKPITPNTDFEPLPETDPNPIPDSEPEQVKEDKGEEEPNSEPTTEETQNTNSPIKPNVETVEQKAEPKPAPTNTVSTPVNKKPVQTEEPSQGIQLSFDKNSIVPLENNAQKTKNTSSQFCLLQSNGLSDEDHLRFLVGITLLSWIPLILLIIYVLLLRRKIRNLFKQIDTLVKTKKK